MSSQLIPGVGPGALLQSELLDEGRAVRVGAIHRIGFDEAVVLTHDKWKHDVGGIARHEFLLATARNVTSQGFDDDEVLLLRVEDTAPLAMESDLLAVREESLRSALANQESTSPSAVLDMDLDVFTKDRISYTGLRCKVLGTFYEDTIDGTRFLAFGSDIDNFYATATYRVLKPIGHGLSAVASYLKVLPGEEVERVRIGTVRFSSTRRRAISAGLAAAPVTVNILDFIGHKTGMFGMTRMGKSNTMKTIVARTQVVSQTRVRQNQPPIGQLILDPQGEYANENTQDESAIAAIGDNRVVIYRFGGAQHGSHVRPLGINFYDPAQLNAAKGMIVSALAEGGADYVRAFLNADFEGSPLPGETTNESQQRRKRAERGRLMLYGALAMADFPLPSEDPAKPGAPFRVWLSLRKEVAEAIDAAIPGSIYDAGRGRVGVERDSIVKVCEWIAAAAESIPDVFPTDAKKRKGFEDGLDSLLGGDPIKSALPIFTQRNQGRMVSGFTKLKPLRPFHDASSKRDYRDEIYAELKDGKIVIVDLHLGPEAVTRTLAEEIAGRLLEHQTEAFTAGKDAPAIQVVLEEAHNLFGAKAYSEDLDVWVKLAKEASKLNIGMIYATQEVSGVAHQVLANTKNWVVAHLNNTKELRHLGQFYDFSEFESDILSAEDKGFVRLKTLSSPYIVPVQIDRYGVDLVNEARAAAGDPPLPVGSATPDATSAVAGNSAGEDPF